jgi:hypothetical protein
VNRLKPPQPREMTSPLRTQPSEYPLTPASKSTHPPKVIDNQLTKQTTVEIQDFKKNLANRKITCDHTNRFSPSSNGQSDDSIEPRIHQCNHSMTPNVT